MVNLGNTAVLSFPAQKHSDLHWMSMDFQNPNHPTVTIFRYLAEKTFASESYSC